MDDRTLSLLGDCAAQERITERGELLPCPCCGGNARIRYTGNGSGPLGYISNIYMRSKPGFVMCDKCGLMTSRNMRSCRAVKKWNTRAPILTPKQIERLEEENNAQHR